MIEQSLLLQHIALCPFLRHFPTHFVSFARCDKRYSMENYLLSSPESCLCMFITCMVKGSMERRICEDLEICIIVQKDWGSGLGSHKHYWSIFSKQPLVAEKTFDTDALEMLFKHGISIFRYKRAERIICNFFFPLLWFKGFSDGLLGSDWFLKYFQWELIHTSMKWLVFSSTRLLEMA